MLLLDSLLNLVAPHNCLVCNKEGLLVCSWCQLDACPAVPSRCYECQKATADSAVCPTCRRKTKLKHLWVSTEYQNTAKELVHRLKFVRAGKAAALIVAGYLNETLPYFESETIVTYVPTATSRIRQRGYDQSALIAKTLASQRGLPYATVLSRQGQSRQVGAHRFEREAQLINAFRPKNEYLIKNARVLIIDDVFTTGATIGNAARVLKEAGARQVDGAVFAQAK